MKGGRRTLSPFLLTFCSAHGYNKLVLAQHLDDLAESFLMSAMHNGQVRCVMGRPPETSFKELHVWDGGGSCVIVALSSTLFPWCAFFPYSYHLKLISYLFLLGTGPHDESQLSD